MKMLSLATGLVISVIQSGFSQEHPAAAPGCPHGGGGTSSCPTEARTAGDVIRGKVTQTMNAGRYTYVAVDDGSGEKWAAAPAVEVKVGDTVEVASGVPMKSFYSKTLKRTFPLILFAERITKVTGK